MYLNSGKKSSRLVEVLKIVFSGIISSLVTPSRCYGMQALIFTTAYSLIGKVGLSYSKIISFPISSMKRQLAEHLMELGFVTSSAYSSPEVNQNSKNPSLLKAIVCAGLYPNVAKILYVMHDHTFPSTKLPDVLNITWSLFILW